MPGLPKLDPTQITAVFITRATIAFGKAALWLRGWQQFVQSPDGRVGALFDAQPHHENGHVPGAAPAPQEAQ